MMVMRRSGAEVTFLGSAFLVHSDGYLLTAARILPEGGDLVVVPLPNAAAFVPVSHAEVAPIPVEIVSTEATRDVALLKIEPDLTISVPGEILGRGDSDPTGSTLMSVGVPFGYYRIHSVLAVQSVLAGRLRSRSDTNLLVFDRRVQYGDVGGPLVSVRDGVVIGVVGGVFDPLELEGERAPKGGASINSDLSYATSIEYGRALLEEALSSG